MHFSTFSTEEKESPPLISAKTIKINLTRIFMDDRHQRISQPNAIITTVWSFISSEFLFEQLIVISD